MFTGLVEETGEIVAITRRDNARVVRIRTAIPLSEVAIGDSIAVDGACLTVAEKAGETFTAVAGRETLDKTRLGAARAGDRVHLERALRVGDRLGGHLVQGHVDGLGTVVESRPAGESHVIRIELPEALARYVAAKGSVTVDGVSLTVNEIEGRVFRVDVVPHTAEVTTLATRSPGERVNIEVDVLAKYVERLLGAGEPYKGLSLQTLRENGFA